ncbi:MAG: hypothetical protein ACOX6D_04320 [Thermoguttaceae bacterium]|jgi:hypothetical protein
MARFLAVDWDRSEVRFLYGTFSGDRLVLLKSGAAPIISDSEKEPTGMLPEDEPEEEPASEGAPHDLSGGLPENIPDEEDEGASPGEAEEPRAKKRKLFSKPSPAKDDASIKRGLVLKRLLREHGVPAGPVILCLPRDHADLLNLTLPKLAESELPDIVKNQVLRDSTAYIEGHPLDFIPLGDAATKNATRKIFSASISRIELRNLRTFCAAAGRRAAKIELRLTTLAEFVRSGRITAEEPVLLVQEGRDEVNFALFREGMPTYFRAVQFDSELPPADRRQRLVTEIIRTGQIAADEEPVSSVLLFGQEGEYADLVEDLNAREVQVEVLDPFSLTGIETRPGVTGNAARFAPLLGALLAERGKKARPILDFLHPRQKPKPPNYALPFFVFLLLLGAAFPYLWHRNKKDLLHRNAEVAQLARNLSSLQGEYNMLRPQYSVLDSTVAWERYGVTLLDELRDILLRLPPAPDLLISRMAYNGFDPQYNCPVFIISAKITAPQVYRRFYRNMTSDNAYGINSRGAVQVPTVTDDETKRSTEYNFTAVIFCRRRAPQDYLRTLPDNLRAISHEKPEFYDQRTGAPTPNGQDRSPASQTEEEETRP